MIGVFYILCERKAFAVDCGEIVQRSYDRFYFIWREVGIFFNADNEALFFLISERNFDAISRFNRVVVKFIIENSVGFAVRDIDDYFGKHRSFSSFSGIINNQWFAHLKAPFFAASILQRIKIRNCRRESFHG